MFDVISAHKRSSNHRAELMNSSLCDSFHCLEVFAPSSITDWVDWPPETPAELQVSMGTTAMCPSCGIDSVIGSSSGYPITKTFLAKMRAHWFQT
jgi:hypothetical protein